MPIDRTLIKRFSCQTVIIQSMMVVWKEFACSINIIKYSETCSWLLHFTPSSFEKYAEAFALFLHHMRTSHLRMKDTLLPKDKMGKAKISFELWLVYNKIWTRWLHPMKYLTDVIFEEIENIFSVSIDLKKHEWRCGRTRNVVGTRVYKWVFPKLTARYASSYAPSNYLAVHPRDAVPVKYPHF